MTLAVLDPLVLLEQGERGLSRDHRRVDEETGEGKRTPATIALGRKQARLDRHESAAIRGYRRDFRHQCLKWSAITGDHRRGPTERSRRTCRDFSK
jgi:hypothetical protein